MFNVHLVADVKNAYQASYILCVVSYTHTDI